jgi:Zn-dependent oligopeptidase
MVIHNPPSREDLLNLDETQLYKHLYEQFKFYSLPEPSQLHAGFDYLTTGYDAGYYSYLWYVN